MIYVAFHCSKSRSASERESGYLHVFRIYEKVPHSLLGLLKRLRGISNVRRVTPPGRIDSKPAGHFLWYFINQNASSIFLSHVFTTGLYEGAPHRLTLKD